MLVSVCWVGGFESEVQTNNSRGIHVCQRFFSISKQCDFIICDVLLERLSVRLAEGSYLLNLFYIFVLRKLRTANCMCSTVIHCYHWCFRKRTNAASAYIIICMITRDVGGADARCKGNADNYLGICDRLELASILISHFAA